MTRRERDTLDSLIGWTVVALLALAVIVVVAYMDERQREHEFQCVNETPYGCVQYAQPSPVGPEGEAT